MPPEVYFEVELILLHHRIVQTCLNRNQERRIIQRLTFMYKILNGQVAVPAELIDLELSATYKPRRL